MIRKENRRFYIGMIKKQLYYAESKHPEFAHYFDSDIFSESNEKIIKDVKRKLEIRRNSNDTLEKTKMIGALDILQEEVYEANAAFLEEDYDNCLQELAQCGAVIIRAMDLVKNKMEKNYRKYDVDEAIAELKRENEKIKKFNAELVKDCKWLCTEHTPEINGFETIVLCTNGKKRVASFRNFDLRWYDVNNGNKLNVVKWLWQPTMPKE